MRKEKKRSKIIEKDLEWEGLWPALQAVSTKGSCGAINTDDLEVKVNICDSESGRAVSSMTLNPLSGMVPHMGFRTFGDVI